MPKELQNNDFRFVLINHKEKNPFEKEWQSKNDYSFDSIKFNEWIKKGNKIALKGSSKLQAFKNIFHNPNLPVMDDYYEPWTYKYEDLINSPESNVQPTARPISMVTGEYIDIKGGPNWDDDLSGSEEFAKNDPNLDKMSEEEKEGFFNLQRLVMTYLPRICNHCLNPSCLASCPSGAIYKRGEDGIVLINQDA